MLPKNHKKHEFDALHCICQQTLGYLKIEIHAPLIRIKTFSKIYSGLDLLYFVRKRVSTYVRTCARTIILKKHPIIVLKLESLSGSNAPLYQTSESQRRRESVL